MRFLFFRINLGFSANQGRFTPEKPWSQPCASRNEFTYSPRGTACKNPLVHRSDTKNLTKLQKKRSVLERGTASGYFSSDYAPWAKTRTTPREKRHFELGTSRTDCGLFPRSVWLISSGYRSKTNINEENVKLELRIKCDPHMNRLQKKCPTARLCKNVFFIIWHFARLCKIRIWF